jgi:hypothetical protein
MHKKYLKDFDNNLAARTGTKVPTTPKAKIKQYRSLLGGFSDSHTAKGYLRKNRK